MRGGISLLREGSRRQDRRHDDARAAKGFSVTVGVEQPAEAERIFKALSKDGTIRMPMEETFWAHRFGMLVDQYGIPWMINCEKAH